MRQGVWTVALFSVAAMGATVMTGGVATCVLNATVPSHLPSAVVSPVHTDLYLSLPDPNTLIPAGNVPLVFSGAATSTFVVHAVTTCVVLHGKNLTVDSEVVLNGANMAVTVTYVADVDFVVIEFGAALPLGSITLAVAFKGIIQDSRPGTGGNAVGLFVSANAAPPSLSRADTQHILRNWARRGRHHPHGPVLQRAPAAVTIAGPMMLATQLEETDARRLWPCMDEPSLKMTVQVTIKTPATPGLRALGNTECVASADGTTTVCPSTRNPLPTYLIAVAVGEFDVLSTVSRGVTYRVFTPPGLAQWAAHGLNCTVHAAEFFGDLLELPYGAMNTKMDSLAVGGIDMDAMENQGLLTYAPQMLLLNPDGNAMPEVPDGYIGQQILIALVTTHEIAHMWFGDTATLPDWTQMFLNEGFARYLQYVGADDLFRTWDLENKCPGSVGRAQTFFQFTLEVFMGLDADGSASPAVLPLYPLSAFQEQEAATETFHRMLYEKGAVINRMAHDFLGPVAWFKALGAYMQTFLWGTPTLDGLLKALDPAFAAAGAVDATTSLGPWLNEPNFPVVTFALSAPDADGQLLTVTQIPLSKYTLASPNGTNVFTWWVPLPVLAASGTTVLQLQFSTPSAVFSVPTAGPVFGNVNFTMPYIVRYTDTNVWSSLLDALVAEKATLSLREALFQSVLLAQQRHDVLSTTAFVAAKVGPFLAAQANLTGDPADLYDFAYQQLAALSARAGSAAVCQHAVDVAITAMALPLVARLGFAGAELPGTTVLADSLFYAVRANDQRAQAEALSIFNAAATPNNISGTVVKAACFAAAQNGLVTPLVQWYGSAAVGSVAQAAVLLAVTAAVATDCSVGLGLVANLTDPTAQLTAVQNVLLHSRSTACRSATLAFMTGSVAVSLWSVLGTSAGTDAIVAGVAALVAGPTEVAFLRTWAALRRVDFSDVQYANLFIKTAVALDLWGFNGCTA